MSDCTCRPCLVHDSPLAWLQYQLLHGGAVKTEYIPAEDFFVPPTHRCTWCGLEYRAGEEGWYYPEPVTATSPEAYRSSACPSGHSTWCFGVEL